MYCIDRWDLEEANDVPQCNNKQGGFQFYIQDEKFMIIYVKIEICLYIICKILLIS
jgi:hypothetical protein